MSHKHKPDNDDVEIVSEESETRHIGKSDAKLRAELHDANIEKQKYLEGWQRAQADLVNYKRESEKSIAQASARATTALIGDLLAVLDSFDLAFANKVSWESAPKNWRDGVTYIHQQLLVVLRERGVEAFSPEGEHFDPREHESIAVVSVENPDHDGTIVAVIQKGYRAHGEILRPARVHVGQYQE